MNNKIFSYIFKTLFILIMLVLIFIGIKSYCIDSSLLFLDINKDTSFINLLDYTSNSYYIWKFQSGILNASLFISKLFNTSFDISNYYLNILIFTIFLTFLIKSINNSLKFFNSSIIAINFSLLIMLFFGNKVFLISSITFLPFYMLSLLYLYKRPQGYLFYILLYILSSIFLIKSANELSFLYIIFSILLTKFSLNKNYKFINILLILTLCSSLFYITVTIPHLSNLDYPWYAKVVKDDGIEGVVRPLLIESTLIPFVDENVEKTLYSPFMFLLGLYFLFIIRKYFKSKDFTSKALSYTLLFFIISFIVEIYFSQNFAILFFFKTIWRLVPSIYTISFYPIFLFLMLFTFLFFVVLNLKNFVFLFLLNIIACILTIFNNFTPHFIDTNSLNFISTLKTNSKILNEYKDILISPSASVIKTLGLNVLINKDILLNQKMFRNIKILTPTISSNYGSESLKELLNKNPKKRYSTFKGRQDGDEWLEIKLSNVNLIKGLLLDTGVFKTDFPNKIKIIDCKNNITISENENLGNIEYTPSGLPYYGGQHKMTILFSNDVNTDCIKIMQTGINKNFEWSISQIKFILPNSVRKD